MHKCSVTLCTLTLYCYLPILYNGYVFVNFVGYWYLHSLQTLNGESPLVWLKSGSQVTQRWFTVESTLRFQWLIKYILGMGMGGMIFNFYIIITSSGRLWLNKYVNAVSFVNVYSTCGSIYNCKLLTLWCACWAVE